MLRNKVLSLVVLKFRQLKSQLKTNYVFGRKRG